MSWTEWVLCQVTAVDEQTVSMMPIAEENGKEFSFLLPPNLTPPKEGEYFRFTPMERVS